jgi:hypothetical protein
LTCNTLLLKAAAIASAKRTFEAFGHPVEEFIEVLRPYPPVGNEGAAPSLISSSSELQLRY